MAQKAKPEGTKVAEKLGEVLAKFGKTLSVVLDDPKLQESAKDFSQSVTDSARIVARNIKDEEMRKKLKEVGKAAQDLGNSLSEAFKTEKR